MKLVTLNRVEYLCQRLKCTDCDGDTLSIVCRLLWRWDLGCLTSLLYLIYSSNSILSKNCSLISIVLNWSRIDNIYPNIGEYYWRRICDGICQSDNVGPKTPQNVDIIYIRFIFRNIHCHYQRIGRAVQIRARFRKYNWRRRRSRSRLEYTESILFEYILNDYSVLNNYWLAGVCSICTECFKNCRIHEQYRPISSIALSGYVLNVVKHWSSIIQ